MDNIGKNTPNSEKLRGFIDRVESLNQQIKDLQDDKKVVMAEAKAAGYAARGMRHVFAARKLKPHDRQEQEQERDIYMHAMGMGNEPPLFRQLAAMARETLVTDKLMEAFKLLVPPNGEIILKIGGKPMRLWRDRDGEAQAEEWLPPDAVENARRSTLPPAPKRTVPNCTADEAEDLGAKAAKENVPVIENPFPFGDERRARWDLGWRNESGGDGMGPRDE
jgi:uncharacterized protein (UPF0335 family)